MCMQRAAKGIDDTTTAEMFRAAMREDLDTLRLLIANGGDITATNSMGQTMLEIAVERHKPKTTSFLTRLAKAAEKWSQVRADCDMSLATVQYRI
eukprot:COSAG05_NODE_1771_length_4112_cov_443.355594_3_plen_95_part_00